MNPSSNWKRVSRGNPCPICNKSDWCLVAPDESAAICARIESPRRAGEAGYVHRLRDDHDFQPRRRVRTIPLKLAEPVTEFAEMAAEFREAIKGEALKDLAVRLGVSATALDSIGIGWSHGHGAWSFPMVDAGGRILGIRLRKPDGFKYAVRGSKEGLFLPATASHDRTLMICEGASDTAALLDLGFTNVAGRPNCSGGIRHIIELVKSRKPGCVVVIADGDEPGQRGASTLVSILLAFVPTLRLVMPPNALKDVRAWRQAGATRADLLALVDAAPVRRLTIRNLDFKVNP